MQRQRGTGLVGFSRRSSHIFGTKNGYCPVEDKGRLRRIRHDLDFDSEATPSGCLGQYACTPDHEKGRDARFLTPRPAFRYDLRPDPRRIAKGNGEGSHDRCQLYSM